jgi:hypothetical protein
VRLPGSQKRDLIHGLKDGFMNLFYYAIFGRLFVLKQRQEIVLFSIASRPALGPTQLPTKCVPEALSLMVKLQNREADHSPPSSDKVKNGGAMISFSYTSSCHGT